MTESFLVSVLWSPVSDRQAGLSVQHKCMAGIELGFDFSREFQPLLSGRVPSGYGFASTGFECERNARCCAHGAKDGRSWCFVQA
jgi:hypothetical protein